MKFTAVFVAAFALISGVAAKDCCCTTVNTGRCDCVSGYGESTNCDSICTTRGSVRCK